MFKKLVSLMFFYIFMQKSQSQPFVDLVNLRYQYFPGVQYANSNNKMSINEYTTSLSLPLQLKNKNIILTGASLDQLNFTSSNTKAIKILYSLTVPIGYIHKWQGTKWKTLLMALPKISADILSLSKEVLQLGGVAIFTYQQKENLAYKFAIYYNSEFFGPFIVPLVGIDWKPNKKLNVYGLLPSTFTTEYKLNQHLYGGISYNNLTTTYRINGTKNFIRNGHTFWGNNQFKIFGNYYVKKYVMIFGEAGYTIGRKYESYKNNHTLLSDPLFTKTNNGLIINVGLAYRLRLDN